GCRGPRVPRLQAHRARYPREPHPGGTPPADVEGDARRHGPDRDHGAEAFSAWRSARKNQPFDMYTRGGWWSDYEDPTNWYNIFFVDGWLNSHWQHEQFLQLVKAAAPELNKAKRIALYDQADRILERESP